MWTRLLFVVLVAAASAQAWTPKTSYSYKVQSRTLSALHQVGDQYSGMLMRATLKLHAQSENKLYAKLSQPEYANVHQALPGGWGSPIAEQSLEWQKLELTNKPFIIQLRNGAIDRLAVDPEMPEWELNMIKGIVSQLQVDAKAENYFNSRYNDLPFDDSENAVFKAMEDTVTGKCEVLYDISPLPEYVLQSHPQLVPKPSANPEDAQTLDIVKSTNYSHCDQRPAFHHGFSGENNLEPASSKMGQFFARSSVSRVIITGRPSKHLIQSSVTTNKVILSPVVYNNQKGMVVSRMNLTLLSVNAEETNLRWEEAEQQATLLVNDLVYDLKHPNAQQQSQERDSSEEMNQQYGEQRQQQNQEQRMQGAAAERFRRSLRSAQQQRQQIQYESQESSNFEDSSIDSEYWQKRKPEMDQAPKVPFLPFFTAFNGQSIQSTIDAVEKTADIARDIAKDLQNPKDVPEKATLTKFTILYRLVQTMSTEQLQKVTEQMYTSEENTKESKAWKVYRDAVSQAGTSLALIAMKEWIESKKIQGEEAAEMLAQLPETALIPTKEYIHTFFKIATSDVVRSQRYLNTTALLTFTNLVRNAQVDRRSAHNQFPTHTFGRMNPTHAQAVTRDYIPYLASELRQAVRDGDSVLIQTYIRALGNVAHPKILAVFEPYLEGEKQVSDFQRLHMVVALNKIVKVHPSLARAVLYRIYKNVSEKPEVRSAAVYLLMKTIPPASMLQRLAESTNYEYSNQVRSAVKTALEYAAALDAPESQQLSENAQAAIYALNATRFGPEYSRIKLSSSEVSEGNVAYRAALSSIGSEDYLFPRGVFAHFRQIFSGLEQNSKSAGYMASSTKDLINLLTAQSGKQYQRPVNKDISSETAQQIEGNFFFKSLQGERFYAFDNHTIERIPSALKKMINKLSSGQSFSLQKMYNKESLTLAFPTASGLPFYYTLETPTIVSVEGKIKTKVTPEVSASWKNAKAVADVKFLYSSKTKARIGFVTPFDSKIHVAGADMDAQINLPISAEMEMTQPKEGSEIQKTSLRMKVEPRKPAEDTQIATLRSKAFTSQQHLRNLQPAQQKTIHVQKPQQWKYTLGKQETGMAFRVEATSEAQFFDFSDALRQLKNYDALSALASIADKKKISNYQYTVTYDHDQSSSKAVVFTADYGRLDKKPDSQTYEYPESRRTQSHSDAEEQKVFDDNPAIPSNTQPNSAERLQQFLNRIAGSMEISRADAIDVSAQFKGEREAVYIATVAAARRPMKERLAALVYLRHAPTSGRKHEIAMFPSVHIPAAPLANYQKAINNKPTAFLETKVSFSEDFASSESQIHIKSELERTSEREQYVREQPISQLCQQQASHGNNYLPACRNATLAAGHLNKYEVVVKYSGIPESLKNATYKAYSLLRQFGWEYNTEDLVTAKNSPRQINFNVRFAPNLEAANMSIHAPQMNAEFKNVQISPVARSFVVAHPNYKPSELFSQYVLGRSYYPTCTIDKSTVSTFDNRTYPLGLEEEWYLVAQYVPKKYEQTKYSPASQVAYFKIQTRQTPTQQKEVKITLGEEDVIYINPRGEELPEIKVNNQVYKVKAEATEVQSKVDDRVCVRFYLLPSGTVKFTAPEYSLDITYDITTFVLSVGNEYRGDIRGLCGTFDGETETDFTAPKRCIMKDDKNFIRSYTVTEDGNTKHKDFSSELRTCIYKKYSRGDVVSEYEAGRQESQQTQKYFRTNQSQRQISFRTKVVEHENQICFSLRPQPTCSGASQATAQQKKSLPFHCVADSAVARHWAKKAQQGVSLDVASKGSNKNLSVKVPEDCQI